MKFEGYNNRFTYSAAGGVTGLHHYFSLMSTAGVNMVYVGEYRGSPFGRMSHVYNTVFSDKGITPDILREHAFRTDLFIIEKKGPLHNLIGWSKREGIDIPFLFIQEVKGKTNPKRDVTMDIDWYFYQSGQPSLKSLMDADEKLDHCAFTDLATGYSQTISTFINSLVVKEKIREYYETHGRKDSTSIDVGPSEV